MTKLTKLMIVFMIVIPTLALAAPKFADAASLPPYYSEVYNDNTDSHLFDRNRSDSTNNNYYDNSYYDGSNSYYRYYDYDYSYYDDRRYAIAPPTCAWVFTGQYDTSNNNWFDNSLKSAQNARSLYEAQNIMLNLLERSKYYSYYMYNLSLRVLSKSERNYPIVTVTPEYTDSRNCASYVAIEQYNNMKDRINNMRFRPGYDMTTWFY